MFELAGALGTATAAVRLALTFYERRPFIPYCSPFPGISLIALGIGTHVNMAELLQMTGDSELAFDNQTLAQQSVDRVGGQENHYLIAPFGQFTGIFRQLATAELCEFARGGNGADIHCGQDAVEVRTSTARPFRGRFYVQGQWDDPECGIGAPLEGNGTELSGSIVERHS